MSDSNEPTLPKRRHNPLIWFGLIIIGLILYVILGTDRGDLTSSPEVAGDSEVSDVNATDSPETIGEIDRSLLVPPGLRARQYIEKVREAGKPYALQIIVDRAKTYQAEGSLADAHLLYFFASREGHLPAMMAMGEMSDPTRFHAENSLLDQADVIQAYKWYQRAASQGHTPAVERIRELKAWADEQAKLDNPHARQLLLNFKKND